LANTKDDIWVNLFSDELNQVQFSFGLGAGEIQRVSGKTRVLMQWVKVLMTRPGSNIFDLNYGTVFSELVNSNTSDDAYAREVGAAGIDQATAIIKKNQLGKSFPAGERLENHELLSFEKLSDTSVSFIVSLVNELGESMLVGIRTGS